TQLQWFDTEHAGLSAATDLAAEQDRHSLVWQLVWLLNEFRLRRGHIKENETPPRPDSPPPNS
ncbi:MAG: hypothetical protein LC721_12675, partial [Actinobacteria bacterium]|nr:hypothetical protein [Actinomycetota bacterium]